MEFVLEKKYRFSFPPTKDGNKLELAAAGFRYGCTTIKLNMVGSECVKLHNFGCENPRERTHTNTNSWAGRGRHCRLSELIYWLCQINVAELIISLVRAR
jgi:hypothetical protein